MWHNDVVRTGRAKEAQAKSANQAENCLILLTRQASTKNAAPPRIPCLARAGQAARVRGEGEAGGAELLTGQTCQSRRRWRQLLTEGVAAHNYADCRQDETRQRLTQMQMQMEENEREEQKKERETEKKEQREKEMHRNAGRAGAARARLTFAVIKQCIN